MRIVPENRKIGILLSGRGSNFEAISERIASCELDAEIVLVLSNNEDAPGLLSARQKGMNAAYLCGEGISRKEFDNQAVKLLQDADVGLVCLAGFMRILSPVFINAFSYRILNIHPSLLPAFPGLHAQRQAFEHGVRFSGCTVHFVDESLDGGPIICQASVPVLGGDGAEELSERILAEEHSLYPKAIDLVLSGRCEIEARRVRIHG